MGGINMAKFYVESGEFRVVVQAAGPVAAAARALSWATCEDQLAPTVSVNERGFPGNRQAPSPSAGGVVLETGTLLGLIQEHELG
jgi:hypothetical protein